MTHTRRIGALSALALTLVLGACSTSEDLTAPTFEPQFGTADEDRGVDVATVSTGRIYSLSEQFGDTYEYYSDGTSEVSGFYAKAFLRRYDSSGNLTWSKEIATYGCSYEYYECGGFDARTLQADSQGYTYALVSYGFTEQDSAEVDYYNVYKYDAAGNQVKKIDVGKNGISLGGNDSAPAYTDVLKIAVDSGGNIYVAGQKGEIDDDYSSVARSNIVAKYSSSGSLLWQRTSTVGVPTDITVSSSGSVYVVGTKGVARYSNSGGLTWTKTGNFEEVIISGSNLYTRYRKDIRKYDSNGKQLWLKTQSGLSTIVLQAIDGDGSGNVYLSGKYDAGGGNFNAMIRKLNSSGSVLWTKTYGTSAYDDALGIATITGSEIYTTGETQGSLAHTNIGGRDGYLRKFSSSGSALWTR